MNTLKYLQTHEYLLDVDVGKLFANLEALSQVSYTGRIPIAVFSNSPEFIKIYAYSSPVASILYSIPI